MPSSYLLERVASVMPPRIPERPFKPGEDDSEIQTDDSDPFHL